MSRQSKALALTVGAAAIAAATAAHGISTSAADPTPSSGASALQPTTAWLGGPIAPQGMERKEREGAHLVLAAESARAVLARQGGTPGKQARASIASTLGPAPDSLSGGLAARHLVVRRAVRTRFGTVKARLNVLAGSTTTVAGTLRPISRGRKVELQLRHDHHWIQVAHAHTGRRGRYVVRYRPATEGGRALRVRFPGGAHLKPSTRHVGELNVYQLAVASWYGGGGTMACGGELTSSTLGVANKTLPCGTMVRLRYGGRSIRVPVVDRGPYVAGREFDLTEATKNALGFAGVGDVWSMD